MASIKKKETMKFINKSINKLHSNLYEQFFKLNENKSFYQNLKNSHNNKALLELPDEDVLLEYFKDEIESNTETLKAWYSVSTATFMTIDPIFNKNCVPKTEIVTKAIRKLANKLYYKGEVNEDG